MASTHPPRLIVRGLERAVLVILIGLMTLFAIVSLFLGPVLVFPIIILGLLALAIGQLARSEEARQAAALATAAGAREPVEVWGKVVHIRGQCPDGPTPQPGQMFAVAGGDVWPELCIHARRIVLDELTRIEADDTPDEEPVRYHDAAHTIELALYKAPGKLRAAA